MSKYRYVQLPTPAVWSHERLAVLRDHLATQDPTADATMAGTPGPRSPIRYEGYPIRVDDALRKIDHWIAEAERTASLVRRLKRDA